MPSASIKDASGATITVQTLPAVGSAASAASLPVVVASDQTVPVSVLGRTARVVQALTVTAASAYAAGNVVGGLLTLASVVDAAGSGVLHGVELVGKAVQTTGYKLYLFNANPTASTFTNKAAPAIAAADFNKLVGVFSFPAADSGLGTHTLYSLDGLSKAFVIPSGSSLYAILVCTGTPTYGSTSELSIALTVLKD